jgi:hypothetical protein
MEKRKKDTKKYKRNEEGRKNTNIEMKRSNAIKRIEGKEDRRSQ